MKKNTFVATLENEDGEIAELTVTAFLVDQVAAERELRNRGTTAEQSGITFVSAMCWAALARTEQITDRFDAFLKRCHDVSRPDDEAGEDVPDLDPSRPGQSSGSA